MRILWVSEKQRLFLHTVLNLSFFITEAENVYCAVRTGPLNTTDPVCP
jgi:hypothetical protein